MIVYSRALRALIKVIQNLFIIVIGFLSINKTFAYKKKLARPHIWNLVH